MVLVPLPPSSSLLLLSSSLEGIRLSLLSWLFWLLCWCWTRIAVDKTRCLSRPWTWYGSCLSFAAVVSLSCPTAAVAAEVVVAAVAVAALSDVSTRSCFVLSSTEAMFGSLSSLWLSLFPRPVCTISFDDPLGLLQTILALFQVVVGVGGGEVVVVVVGLVASPVVTCEVTPQTAVTHGGGSRRAAATKTLFLSLQTGLMLFILVLRRKLDGITTTHNRLVCTVDFFGGCPNSTSRPATNFVVSFRPWIYTMLSVGHVRVCGGGGEGRKRNRE